MKLIDEILQREEDVNEFKRLIGELKENISEARNENQISDWLEGAEDNIECVEMIFIKSILLDVSSHLKNYSKWIGENEFTMFAENKWHDCFGNKFSNNELYKYYLKNQTNLNL